MSDYIIQIIPEPELINNKPRYFWCIIKNMPLGSSSNYGFGWAASADAAFCDAYAYYNKFIPFTKKKPLMQ